MADVYYEGQSLDLTLDTGDSDIATADTTEIWVYDPNGNVTEVAATVTETTKLTCNIYPLVKGQYVVKTYADYGSNVIKKGREHPFEVIEDWKEPKQ